MWVKQNRPGSAWLHLLSPLYWFAALVSWAVARGDPTASIYLPILSFTCQLSLIWVPQNMRNIMEFLADVPGSNPDRTSVNLTDFSQFTSILHNRRLHYTLNRLWLFMLIHISIHYAFFLLVCSSFHPQKLRLMKSRVITGYCDTGSWISFIWVHCNTKFG